MSKEYTPKQRPATTQQSENILLKMAIDGVEQISDARINRELFGVDIDEDGRAVSSTGEHTPVRVVATLGIYSSLALAYLAGRADQIADVYGDNVKRSVRARGIPEVVDAANITRDSGDKISSPDILEEFARIRGALGSRAVTFRGPSPEAVQRFLEFIEQEKIEIDIVTVRSLKLMQAESDGASVQGVDGE